MHLTVALTGLCRRADVLEASLRELAATVGPHCRLLVSTWDEEVAGYQRAFDSSPFDVEFLTPDKPLTDWLAHGNFLLQQTSLRAVADHCLDGLVLRTRSDVALTAPLLERVVALADSELPVDASSPYAVFKAKVWVPWADYEEGFHVADECFLTSAQQLRSMVTFDLESVAKYGFPRANAHTVFYGRPFWSKYAMLDEYLLASRRSGIHLNLADPRKFHLLEAALRRDEYLAYIALWWRLLLTNFEVSSRPPVDIRFYPGGGDALAHWYRPTETQAAASFADLFSASRAGFHNHFYTYDLGLIRRVTDGSASDATSRRFQDIWDGLDELLARPRQAWREVWADFFEYLAREVKSLPGDRERSKRRTWLRRS